MVLINGLTIDEINAALIALQRGQGEVVGGVKGTTIQNISISNSSNGSSSPDFTPQINALLDKGEELTEAVQDIKGKQNDMQTELENMGNSLMAHGVKGLFWDSSTNMLSIIMQNNQPLSVEIPSDTVTLTLGDDNVLHFTMGGANDYYPQTIDLTLPYIRSSEKGSANGVATLDSTGRIPYSQLPESAMTFLGEWDASTNTPHLEDGTGVNGDFYVCSAGGTVNFGTQASPRNITFYPNDRVIYEGENDQWFRLPAGEVRTVNGMSGDVTLNANNIDYSSGVTIKDKIDSIEPVQSDWEEDDPNDPAYIKNKIPIWIESGQADDNMTPVDNVTDGQMRPVTSNAVYDALQNVATEMPVYPTVADAEADLPNLEEGDFVATPDGNGGVTDEVTDGDMRAVTSNAVAESLSYSLTEIDTGAKWIDGKTIYRLTVGGLNTTIQAYSNANIFTDSVVSQIDTLISYKGIGKDSGNNKCVNSFTNMIVYDTNKIRCRNNEAIFTINTLVLEYTKTS